VLQAQNTYFLLFVSNFNIEQIIEDPTHFTDLSQELIDLFFVSYKNTVIKSGVGDYILYQEQRYHISIF
jgi:hypothetical protein